MYVCLNCLAQFDKPRTLIERHGMDSPPYEEFSACPYCSETEFAETFHCDGCGSYVTGDYIKAGSERYCDECYTEFHLGDES